MKAREYLCTEREREEESERKKERERETSAMDDGKQQFDILRNFSDVQFHGVNLTVWV
jgi:hypothetical protein